jgi:hypothetical protein
MDDPVKHSELNKQINDLESVRHTLINQLSGRNNNLINTQISDVSKEIDKLLIQKQKNTLTMVNIKKILQKHFDVLDKNKKMIITVKPIFTTDLFIIYYLSKEYDDIGRYILDVFKKEVNTLTIFDKTTWFNEETDVLKVYDNKLRGFEEIEDYEGEEFVDRETFRRNNYNFSHSAQFKFYIKCLDNVQIQSICILNGGLVFDIKKVANKIQKAYRKNLIKRKTNAANLIKKKYLEYSYRPGGPGYNRTMRHYYSFGTSSEIKYLKSF